MSRPCIITVAITGSVPRKENNPAVPITVAEQVESTQEAFEAGCAPRVMLRATHERALEVCKLEDLKRHAADLS